MLALVGIDKYPKNPKYSSHNQNDKRWFHRRQTWEKANDVLQDYSGNKIALKTLLDLAKSYGFWSVWMSVFRDYPEVRQALINSFEGTDKTCFNAETLPLPRK
jgi:hypothetical protein